MTDHTRDPIDQRADEAHNWHIIRREQARDPLRRALAGLVRTIDHVILAAAFCGFGTWVVWVMSR